MQSNSYSHLISRANNRGFTLVELMVVVAITTILVNLSWPMYTVFKIKAAQSEARVNLNYMHTLVESYIAGEGLQPTGFTSGYRKSAGVDNCNDNGSQIGFRVDCQTTRYYYAYHEEYDSLSLEHSENAFSVSAIASDHQTTFLGSTYSVKLGRGFGIDSSACKLLDSDGYYDRWDLNQDRGLGFRGQGAFPDYNYRRDRDATYQCAGN